MTQRALLLVAFLLLVGCHNSAEPPSSKKLDAEPASSTKLDEERVERLRKQYPFESLESRLPAPPTSSGGADHLTSLSANELLSFEKVLDRRNEREELLKALHESSVAEFVSKNGNGVGRMGRMPEEILANAATSEDPSVPLSESWKEVDVSREPVNLDVETLNLIHHWNTYYGINAPGFGFVKSRKQVAGFQSHRFDGAFDKEPWKVRRVELVGLLLDKTPRVYVTAGLPRMDEVRKVPTRQLDLFESTGLAKLQAGDFVFIREGSDGIRMLGAIRSAKQCIKCHGGERGDLLGAFSYSLHREPK